MRRRHRQRPPANTAPQLLDPRDKTAGRDPRWAVVPAQWPTKDAAARQLSERPTVETKAYEAQGIGGFAVCECSAECWRV